MPIVCTVGAVGEGERRAAGRGEDALDELGRRDGAVGKARADADGGAAVGRERLDLAGADGPGEQRVVADLQVAVEREVVGGQRDVRVEEQLQAALGGAVERARRAGPEEAVMDEDEVGVLLARACEEGRVRADARDHRLDLLASGYLQSVGPVVVVGRRIQKLVEVANDPVAGCHPHRHCSICHTFR
jgi:hypothetical protein